MKKYFVLGFVTCAVLVLISLGLFINKQASSISAFEEGHVDQYDIQLENSLPKELQNLPYALYPTDIEYDAARFNFNKRFNIFPKAIFLPRTNQEIAEALKLVKKNGLAFSVRSGGHCYEPGSLSSGCVIDLQNFNSIRPDMQKQEVYLGAGARLGDVIEALGKIDYCIPTGTCPSVGVGGLTLGGGMGMLVRTLGLTCDSVRSMTFLTADGDIIEVNEANKPDLFWALRGAGNGSYGIVLGYTFKMYAIPAVSYCELNWEWDSKTVPQIVQTWQAWVQKQPSTINSQLRLKYAGGKSAVSIGALKIGKEPFAEWESDFNPLKPTVTSFTGRYVDSSTYWMENPAYPFFKMKSKILMDPLSPDAVATTIAFFETLQKEQAPQDVLFDFDAFGGKVPDTDTAFFPRKAFGWWYQAMYWKREKVTPTALRYSRQFFSDISKYTSPYSYANTVDYDLGPAYLNAYYGDHVQRLIEIKRKYDPNNVFHWKQSIPLSQQ